MFKKYPTPYAYNAACAALHEHRERADQAEVKVEQLIAERDQWRSNFNELNQDGQEIQDHYKKVARTLWAGNDVPDIDKIAVKFRELQSKAAEQDKEIQHWKDRADRAETMLEDIMHGEQS